MKRFLKTSFIGLALVILGASLLLYIVRSMRSSEVASPAVPVVTSQKTATPPTEPSPITPSKIEGKPVRIDIPSLNISLQVIDGVYDSASGKWTLTKDKAQFALLSQLANNEGGNTFIYGHYRKNVFAALPKIRSGEVAIVTTDNGRSFYYSFTTSRVVAPHQSEGIFDYSGEPILTLQTCTGAFFEKRQLFTFNLIRVA